MKKGRFLGILLGLVIGLMMGMSLTVWAEDYDLLVGGTLVTSENKDNVLDGGNNNTVSYDPYTKTLTLKGATINADKGIIYEGSDPLKIVLAADTETTINSTGIGIASVKNCDLIIDGEGTLKVDANGEGVYCGGNLIINNGKLNVSTTGIVKSPYYVTGIAVDGSITIKAGVVNASAKDTGTEGEARGIHSNAAQNTAGITIEGGSVNASGTGTRGYGIYCDQCPISILGGRVIASGTSACIYREVKNSMKGLGWIDEEGIQGRETVPISDETKIIYGYKKVQFPVDTAKVTTAPAARNLTYTGSAQELVTAGKAEGGDMFYALGTAIKATEDYKTSIPTGTDAGTYYVWYKVVGDANHTDSEPKCVTVTINQKETEAPQQSGGGSVNTGSTTETTTTTTEPTTTAPTTQPSTEAPATIQEPITIQKTPASVKAIVKNNKVTISWKKIKKNKKTKALLGKIKAVQVQYSTDPEFKENVVTKTYKKNKSKVTMKLGKKQTYYIRTRYVGTEGVSAWSSVKRITTK